MHLSLSGPVDVPVGMILLLIGAWTSGLLAGIGVAPALKAGRLSLPDLSWSSRRRRRRRGSYFRSDEPPVRRWGDWRRPAAWVSAALVLSLLGVSALFAMSNMHKGHMNAAAGYRNTSAH